MYKVFNDFNGNPSSIQKRCDGYVLGIPFDPANTDYQAYLAWLAEGNVPEPAEENQIV